MTQTLPSSPASRIACRLYLHLHHSTRAFETLFPHSKVSFVHGGLNLLHVTVHPTQLEWSAESWQSFVASKNQGHSARKLPRNLKLGKFFKFFLSRSYINLLPQVDKCDAEVSAVLPSPVEDRSNYWSHRYTIGQSEASKKVCYKGRIGVSSVPCLHIATWR